MELIEKPGQRTHEIRILKIKTKQSKSFSIKTKDSLQTIFAKIKKATEKE